MLKISENKLWRRLCVVLATVALAVASPLSAPAAHAAAESDSTGSGFHWGVASSGFQVEGSNPDSNWLRYVEENQGNGKVDPVNDAVDFWNRYEEDIANAAAMGANTYRISVEWARIEPEPDRWDEEALAHYDAIINTIRSHGMTPMITMVHYVYPGWLVDRGGFLSDEAVAQFSDFADLITQRWGTPAAGQGGEDTMWVTFNEPLVFFGHEVEIGLIKAWDMPRFLNNVVAAHNAGYDAAHRANPNAMVTANEAFLPAVTGLADKVFLNRIKDKLDYVGIDYYYGLALNNLSAIHAASADFAAVRPQPDGIYEAITHFAGAFPGKPIYIVENGMPTNNGTRADGADRGDFIRDTIFWIQRAIADGYPVIGYNAWSITDNYEWGDYSARFGLYQVDILDDPTLTRRPTSGVEAYRELVSSGGVSEGYRPVNPPAFCSASTIPTSCFNPPAVDGPLARLH
ncbi:Beta-glucosidase A [Corynebacterium ciconiae DSM 44920]|uniref:family 1 glycosylhydrolase n=1 Tax=Corynebacterium ciconiae TaxID=227319 RepID=UPI000370C5F5|nr:family 1 glycosylhydrolase [Corynebacterium ciconiae]WKD60308.1 Beta-glucosidase A [Corynebacterium ciconiae DSM 44920]